MYGTVQDLKEISQVVVTDLELSPAPGQTEEERFDEILEGFLRTAKEFIDSFTGRDFKEEFVATGTPVPEGIKSVAHRLASNMLQDMIMRQDAKVVKRDQAGNAHFRPSTIFTGDLKNELSYYKRNDLASNSWPRFSRVRTPEEIYWDSQPTETI